MPKSILYIDVPFPAEVPVATRCPDCGRVGLWPIGSDLHCPTHRPPTVMVRVSLRLDRSRVMQLVESLTARGKTKAVRGPLTVEVKAVPHATH